MMNVTKESAKLIRSQQEQIERLTQQVAQWKQAVETVRNELYAEMQEAHTQIEADLQAARAQALEDAAAAWNKETDGIRYAAEEPDPSDWLRARAASERKEGAIKRNWNCPECGNDLMTGEHACLCPEPRRYAERKEGAS